MTSETGSRPPITAVRQIPFTQNSFVYLHLYFTVRNSSYQDKSQFWEPEIPRRLLGFSEVPKQEENESPSVPPTLPPGPQPPLVTEHTNPIHHIIIMISYVCIGVYMIFSYFCFSICFFHHSSSKAQRQTVSSGIFGVQ